MRPTVHVPDVTVALSTASAFPEPTEHAFSYARRLGYDAIEVMVWTDPVSQDAEMVAQLADTYTIPVVAVHAPCLLLTQRVWSPDPWDRLRRSADMAVRLGAGVVVVHPPFRWQRDYARGFVDGVRRLEGETGVAIAVENMFPWRAAGRELPAYAPDWDPTDEEYAHCTLDLSHTAVSGSDAMELADRVAV
jgi:sugar phosphate isomerase/epimerase